MNEEIEAPQPFEEWGILELLGHVRVAGIITEEELFGGKIGRIDIPTASGFATQYFGHGSIYRLTPCTEQVARGVAAANQPRPIGYFELESMNPTPEPQDFDDEDF